MTDEQLITCIVADDHNLVRAGIISLLGQIPGVTVLAEAENGRDVLPLIQQHKPTLLLLDISMPLLNGLDTLALVKRDFPATKVVLLSMHTNEEFVIKALKLGAEGYLIKDAAPNELEEMIATVLAGNHYVSPQFVQLLQGINPGNKQEAKRAGGPLTLRQREILQLIAEGKSTKEIADMLFVSIKTVETHRSQIMERLEIHDVPGLVRYAMRQGIISSE